MKNRITWLHLSDLHARKSTDWNAKEITESLCKDLSHLAKKEGLTPDFVFFTGDLAFGSVKGDKLDNQYALVQKFIDSVLNSFDPPISKRNLYIVPGNHDIDRGEITAGEMQWLRAPNRSMLDITNAMQEESKQWRTWMDRFHSYRKFINAYGLTHLNPSDAHLLWADVQNVGSHRIGVCGFNSAWSAADEHDKGKLWAGLEFQIAKNFDDMGPVDISFALIHHPGNWLVSQEDPSGMRQLRQKFQIVLHGHEHVEWVDENSRDGLLISSGACYESSWMENGYSIGHIDLESGIGAIWLREWERIGRGWVAKNIANKTRNGVWPIKIELKHLTKQDGEKNNGPESDPPQQNGHMSLSVQDHFTDKFCTNMAERLDYLELFGCDIPKELQRHQLSVAYVSLNLSSQEAKDTKDSKGTKDTEINNQIEMLEGDSKKKELNISALKHRFKKSLELFLRTLRD